MPIAVTAMATAMRKPLELFQNAVITGGALGR